MQTDIQLVAFDLDGTLIGHDLNLSEGIKVGVAAALARGVQVIIATGREIGATGEYWHALGLNWPAITFQGGVVWDYANQQALFAQTLPSAVLPAIAAFAEREQVTLHFGVGELALLANRHPHPPAFQALLERSPVQYIDGVAGLPTPPNKFLLSVQHPSQRAELQRKLQAEFGDQLTIVASHPYLVEGVPLGTSKGSALAWLANHFGVPQAAVLAVGDNDNDVSMLTWAGVGVAIGDGSPAALAAADWIAPPQHEDGALAALNKFVLQAGD